MQFKRTWIVLLCVMLSLLFIVALHAGTTGKIVGRVIDKSSGEPLPGANISIVGSTYGAASDINGDYVILHIPPGLYELKASVIGFATLSYSNVRIQIDKTTNINFELEMETLTGEEVIVVAEKKVIQEDVATSTVALSGDELLTMPFSRVEEMIELQAGVENGLEIRGGSMDQALFQVDGVTMRDPRNNKPITGVPPSAIKEMSLERGGFNAEYGQVRSGIVNIVTKEGGKRYSGTISAKYSPPAAKYFGISPYDPNSMWCRPYLDDEVCWTGTENGAWDYYEQHQYPEFDGWNTISERLLSDEDPSNDLTPQGAQRLWQWEHRRRPQYDQPDYNIDAGFGGPVPLIGDKLGNLRFFTSYLQEREMLLIPLSRDDYVNRTFSFQLISDINSSMKLRLTGMAQQENTVAINATDFQFYNTDFGIYSDEPWAWSPTFFLRTPLEIASVTNEQRSGRIFTDSWYSEALIKSKSFAARLTHTLSAKMYYEVALEILDRTYNTGPIGERDLTADNEILPGYFVDEAPFGFSSAPTTGIDGMFFGGHTSTIRDSSNMKSYKLKADLTRQTHANNEVKTGVEFNYFDLNFDYGLVNNFFGDYNYVREHNFPFQGSLYFQDKFEAKGFILNAGLRFDFSNANTDWVEVDPFDRDFFTSKYNSDNKYNTESSKWDTDLLPRLSIAHPVSEVSKLFFNYGHFKQRPTYEQLMRIGRDLAGGMRNYGNPNLAQEKTVAYELGYEHSLFNNYLVQISGFYKDQTDELGFQQYTSIDGSISYYTLANNEYSDLRGFELLLKKNTGRWVTGMLNYTYQVKLSGHFGRELIYQNPSEQREYDRLTSNFYDERPIPQPFARANVMLHSPADYGMLLGQWSANFVANWREGEWITWDPFARMNIDQNVQVRNHFNAILRLNKTMKFGKFEVSAFMEINNLFNIKQLSGASFYDEQDQIDYMNSLHLPKSDHYDNIVGDDRAGDFRDDDVAFQPIEQIGSFAGLDVSTLSEGVIYYETSTEKYKYSDGSEVEKGKMDKILEDKAYINMPNMSSFNFLNPRQIFFGIRTSFDLN